MKGNHVGLVQMTLLAAAAVSASAISARAAAWDWNDSRDFIIGGITVPTSDPIAATTVAIVTQSDQGMSLCTGSLIDVDLVVTAGHCVGPSASKMLVVFRKDLSDKTGPVVQVTGYVQDPNYGNGTNDTDNDDIALVSFAGTLREVDTTIAQAHYGQTEVEVEQHNGKGACHGDSGGPAFVKAQDGTLLLFGVTSRGPENQPDTCSSYGIYTNILAHTDFIQSAAAQLRSGSSDGDISLQ